MSEHCAYTFSFHWLCHTRMQRTNSQNSKFNTCVCNFCVCCILTVQSVGESVLMAQMKENVHTFCISPSMRMINFIIFCARTRRRVRAARISPFQQNEKALNAPQVVNTRNPISLCLRIFTRRAHTHTHTPLLAHLHSNSIRYHTWSRHFKSEYFFSEYTVVYHRPFRMSICRARIRVGNLIQVQFHCTAFHSKCECVSVCVPAVIKYCLLYLFTKI